MQFRSYNTELLIEYKTANKPHLWWISWLPHIMLSSLLSVGLLQWMHQEGSVMKLAAVGSSKHAKHLFTSFNMVFVTDLQCGNDCRWHCRSRMHGVTSGNDSVISLQIGGFVSMVRVTKQKPRITGRTFTDCATFLWLSIRTRMLSIYCHDYIVCTTVGLGTQAYIMLSMFCWIMTKYDTW